MSTEATAPSIEFLQFADSKIPEVREVRGRDWVLFGEDNKYPQYLTYLFTKSSKHGSIVERKAKYIHGSGLQKHTPVPGSWAEHTDPATKKKTLAKPINRNGETMDEIIRKSIVDTEIHGGFRWVVIWSWDRKKFEIFHYDFDKFRVSKKRDGYYFCNDWNKILTGENKPAFIPNFNAADRNGRQVFAYDEVRPGADSYPLPGYISCNNSIETDIEISKFHLSSIRNGMHASKLIQFFTGEPDPTKKAEIERKFKKKFAGAESAGKMIISYSNPGATPVNVEDLSSTEQDKLFDVLEKNVQQNILSGHQIVSPMLFGIKTEGQLGGNTELRAAYEIFINTYASPKQQAIEAIVNRFAALAGAGNDYYLKQLDPVGIIIPDALIEKVMKPDEIRERLGLPQTGESIAPAAQQILDTLSALPEALATKVIESLTPDEVRSLVSLPSTGAPSSVPSADGVVPAKADADSPGANDILRNLTGRQYQGFLRVLRQFSSGKINRSVAEIMLRSYGISDEDIVVLLSTEDQETPTTATPSAFSEEDDDEALRVFSEFGEEVGAYEIVFSDVLKPVQDEDLFSQETAILKYTFAVADVTPAQQDVLTVIKKDKRATPDVIASVLKKPVAEINSILRDLQENKVISVKDVNVGADVQIERELITDVEAPDKKRTSSGYVVRYSYDGPKDNRNRPFCAKMMELNKFYSRADIELISQRLGYSVWDRRGGWITLEDGTHRPYCRHRWKINVLKSTQ